MVLVTRNGAEVARWTLAETGQADLATVETLVRLQLAARRLGYRLTLLDPDLELLGLIYLVGLPDVLCGEAALAGQVSGQPEGGEEPGVQEVVVPDNPIP